MGFFPTKLDADTIMSSAYTIYENVTGKLPLVGSTDDLARDYLMNDGSLDEKIDSLIRWQVAKTAASGFASGVPGGFTMAVSIPAGLAAALYVQLRMAAAVAYMRGYDINNDRVKTFGICCLVGDEAMNVLKDAGAQIAMNVAKTAIKEISKETINAINKAVGMRLVTKFGSTGIVNLGKTVPILGGVVGRAMDAASTYAVGKAAKQVFG